MNINEYILLMVQKSGLHQLRLVIYPHYLQVFVHPRWLFGIAELSTVVRIQFLPQLSFQTFACEQHKTCSIPLYWLLMFV